MSKEYKYRNNHVLYFHRDAVTNEIFYVGVGGLKRAYCLASNSRNFMWNRYVQKHGRPTIEIYKTNLTLAEANHLERFFIKKIGRRINDNGNLVNLTVGGEGGTALIMAEKQLVALKERLKNSKAPKGEDHWMRRTDFKMSASHHLAFTKSGKGKKQSSEHIEKRTAPRRGKRQSEESIVKMKATLTGRKLSEIQKKNIGIASKKVWASPEMRSKIIQSTKGLKRNTRKIIDNSTGIIYDSLKDAAVALGIKVSYFSGMMCGAWANKTDCHYVEDRPFKNGRERKYELKLTG